MFRILIALVVLAPLPFGAVHPWAWGLIGGAVGLLLLGWAAERALSREPPAVRAGRVWLILLPFALAAGWAMLQMAPFMPESWSHPLWREAAAALGADFGGFISIDPHATGSAVVKLLSLGGIFWLGLQYGRDRRRAVMAFYALALAGLAYAGYGLIVEFSGARTILWFDKTSYRDTVTSTFVNRNSWATYAGLGLLVTTGLLVRLAGAAYGGADTGRERLRRLLSGLTAHGWILLLAWAVLATALLLSESRGGFLATCAALVVLFGAIGASRAVRGRHAVAMAATAIAAGLAFFALSGDTVTQRLAGTSFERENRMRAYQLTIEATADSAWSGTGYGSFQPVFRMYRDETIPGIYDKAHNSYLETALELGVPAAAALILAIAAAAGLCAAGVRRRRRDVIYPSVGLAAAVLVGVHSLVDFSLQIPAVAATFALILGVGCAQSWSTRRQRV